MSATDRTVRHLHVAAPDEAAVRHLLPTLEDALRCASLGDEGARLVVVKRLALGRVPANISSQALSRLIEQRTAEQARHWVEADTAEAQEASCVAFADALDARVRLALRLLRGAPSQAWYWPLAVPEFAPQGDVAGNLRRMAWAIAGWAQARAALPAWVAALAREGAAPRLATCLTAEQGEALLRRAGMALPAAQAGAELDAASTERPWVGTGESRASPRLPSTPIMTPPWLRALLQASAHGPAPQMPAQQRPAASGRTQHDRPATRPGLVQAQAAPHGEHPARSLPAPWDASMSEPALTLRSPEEDQHASLGAPAAPHQVLHAAHELRPALTPRHASRPWLAPTGCGGLLFLLPVLARLGLPAWLPPQDMRFAALVLRAALLRLRAVADDPAWQLAAARDDDAPAYRTPAPACWADPWLAAPRHGAAPATRLQHCASLGTQAEVWLMAARHWLRRVGRIGLASLVLRPAQLAVSATHADLFFDLAATDLRVRRLGLDIDPGWLPWFGRVVVFHYTRTDT